MKYIFLLIYVIYMIMRTKKNMHMLQQNFYNNSNRYIKWIFNNKNKSFLTIDLFFIIAFVIGYLIKQTLICMTVFYTLVLFF